MKKDNPFTLTFGKMPRKYISRYENMEDIVSTFTADTPAAHTYMIEGVRGSGKTVLMTGAAEEIVKENGWITIDLNASSDLLHDMAIRLYDSLSKMPKLTENGFNLSVGNVGIGVGGSRIERDDVSIIVEYLDHLKKKDMRLLITIDEVLPNAGMRRFASQFQIFLRQNYQVFVIMTGLYENISDIQNDPSLTFLLRSPKINLEPLSIRQIINEYRNVFGIDTEEAKKLAYYTDGYAFAFQALGLLMWEYRNSMGMDEILCKLDDLLDDFVYKKIWGGLTQKEKEIIRAMEGDEPVKTSVICERVGCTASTFSKYKDRLEIKGIMESATYGIVKLKLPRFYQVVKDYQF